MHYADPTDALSALPIRGALSTRPVDPTCSPMDLRHLRSFVAAAEDLHFGRAAARVFLSQPALSRHIQALEAEIGTALFDRSGRGARLTTAGEVFLERARETERTLSAALDAARRAGCGETGRVIVGANGSAIHGSLSRAVAAFRAERPGVELVLREMPPGEQRVALGSGAIDVGFAGTDPDEGVGPTSAVLYPIGSYVAVPNAHPVAALIGSVPLAALAEEPFVAVRRAQDSEVYDGFVRACERAGFTPRVVQEASGAFAMLSLVAAGIGVAMVPGSVAETFSRSGVALRPLTGDFERFEMRMSWGGATQSPALKAFMEVVVTTCPGAE